MSRGFVLSKREALENRIRADRRNIGSVRADTSHSALAALVADVAASWRAARRFGDCELLRGAEHNLDLVAEAWAVRCGGSL